MNKIDILIEDFDEVSEQYSRSRSPEAFHNYEIARMTLRIAIDKLIRTLDWYANPNIYFESDPFSSQEDTYAMVDGGERARHTLNEVE